MLAAEACDASAGQVHLLLSMFACQLATVKLLQGRDLAGNGTQ
jgi:hypothetical protein